MRKWLKRMIRAVFASVTEIGKGVAWICEDIIRDYPEPLSEFTDSEILRGAELRFQTHEGLFSWRRVDRGTKVLLDSLTEIQLEGARILDFACGYGVIGIWAARMGAKTDLADCDVRAIECTKNNLKLNRCSGSAQLATHPTTAGNRLYDMVLSNPPTHVGRRELVRLFAGMTKACSPSGRTRFVIRESLNYERWLEDMGNVSTVVVKCGYKVLEISGK